MDKTIIPVDISRAFMDKTIIPVDISTTTVDIRHNGYYPSGSIDSEQ